MNKSLTKPLIRPLGGRWARVCLTALLTAVVTVGAQARATCESGTRACADSLGGAQDRTAVEGGTPSRTAGDIVLTPPRDLNSELRHRTWSFYTQGGLSWATGVWYRNLDAKRSYRQSAAAGGKHLTDMFVRHAHSWQPHRKFLRSFFICSDKC